MATLPSSNAISTRSQRLLLYEATDRIPRRNEIGNCRQEGTDIDPSMYGDSGGRLQHSSIIRWLAIDLFVLDRRRSSRYSSNQLVFENGTSIGTATEYVNYFELIELLME